MASRCSRSRARPPPSRRPRTCGRTTTSAPTGNISAKVAAEHAALNDFLANNANGFRRDPLEAAVHSAEGIEDEREAAILTELGCPLVQGYAFARPAPPGETAALIRAAAVTAQSVG